MMERWICVSWNSLLHVIVTKQFRGHEEVGSTYYSGINIQVRHLNIGVSLIPVTDGIGVVSAL